MPKKPDTSMIHEMYTRYINLVTDEDFIKTLHDSRESTVHYLKGLNEPQWMHRYAPEKWTPKEVMVHIIDTERIFAYRALRFARRDETALAGFDQDTYVVNSGANARSIHSILEEYVHVRSASIELFKGMDDEAFDAIGTASDRPFSVLAIGFAIAGHELHHMAILKERYFPAAD